MNLDELRLLFETRRGSADEEARALKDSQWALVLLMRFYASLSEDQKNLGSEVLCEWLSSDDAGLRFDAEAMVAEFSISGCSDALLALAQRLKTDASPGAPHEIDKIRRLVAKLSAGEFVS